MLNEEGDENSNQQQWQSIEDPLTALETTTAFSTHARVGQTLPEQQMSQPTKTPKSVHFHPPATAISKTPNILSTPAIRKRLSFRMPPPDSPNLDEDSVMMLNEQRSPGIPSSQESAAAALGLDNASMLCDMSGQSFLVD